jgi:transposase
MEEKILDYLRTSPNGARKREIAKHLQTSIVQILNAMSCLEREGLIFSTTYRDMANMELYDIFQIAPGA